MAAELALPPNQDIKLDPTLFIAINAIAAKQASPTEKTTKALTHLLNYCATFPNVVIRYKASGMVLHSHSDALYMSAEEAHSQAGGHFHLSAASADPNKEPATPSLSSKNAFCLYQNVWLPSMQYSLSVTSSTKSTCLKLMKPFVRAVLPKLGFNRNTA
eukprot:11117013-Ditylum_brightwellii.AAC.2